MALLVSIHSATNIVSSNIIACPEMYRVASPAVYKAPPLLLGRDLYRNCDDAKANGCLLSEIILIVQKNGAIGPQAYTLNICSCGMWAVSSGFNA